eukprot:TRINITY_DN24661_c0_g1_i1.p1 TRINITY_DN24661_c0_g1~~TRINITY_DN24661_c0_g1_i1.p1  ORF type:complete len:180 (-),score=33.05 TRINITY_DN24661_c0_g1_i1:33-572(-)
MTTPLPNMQTESVDHSWGSCSWQLHLFWLVCLNYETGDMIREFVLNSPTKIASLCLTFFANYFSGAVFGCDLFLSMAVGIWRKMSLHHPVILRAIMATPDLHDAYLVKENFTRMAELVSLVVEEGKTDKVAARGPSHAVELATQGVHQPGPWHRLLKQYSMMMPAAGMLAAAVAAIIMC